MCVIFYTWQDNLQIKDITMPANRAITYGHLGTTLRAYFEAIWDEALVPLGGASRNHDDRSSFVHAHILDDYPCTEYRFQGVFGFGGKLRTTEGSLRCRMDYYPENKTKALDQKQAAVNTKLDELWTQYLAARMAEAR
jgi:hypothetical protein